jgi:hypothetical protein
MLRRLIMRYIRAVRAGTASITLVVAIGAPAWAGDGSQVDLSFAAGSVVTDVATFDRGTGRRER